MKNFNKGFFTRLLSDSIQINKNKKINTSQEKEAEDKNLKLLFRSTDPNCNYYLHKNCNHTDFLQPTHVRRSSFSCSTCFHSKLVNEAHSNGFQFIHSEGSFRKYIRPCGHISILSSQTVNNYKHQKCSECFENELQIKSSNNGYEYIGKISGAFREIRFKSCGHSKVVQQTQLQKGNVVCRECIELKHISLCLSKNITLISKETGRERYRNYLLPCGHQKVIRMDHVEDGSYTCEHCDDTHYNKPSKLYLLKMQHEDFSWLKLGFAKDIDVRKSSYGLKPNTTAELLCSIDFETGTAAMLQEKSLHKHFKKHRYPKSLMKQYQKFNGFTECYDISIQDKLLSAINNITRGIH